MSETYRDIRPSDLDDLHAVVSVESVTRMLGGWPWPADRAFTKRRATPYDGGDGFIWAICREDRLIGTVGVTGGHLGYMLHPDWHRQGVMRRAVGAALTKAFGDGAAVVHAGTWHDNPASHALLLTFGFEHWQTTYDRCAARPAPVLGRWYRLLRAAWLEAQRQPA